MTFMENGVYKYLESGDHFYLLFDHQPDIVYYTAVSWDIERNQMASAAWVGNGSKFNHEEWKYIGTYNQVKEQSMQTNQTTATMTGSEGEVIATTTTVTPGAESSVEISQNAKGTPQVTVKVYHVEPEKAAAEAVRVYEQTLIWLKGNTV